MGSGLLNMIMTLVIHLGPNVAGASWSIYQHGFHVDYGRAHVSDTAVRTRRKPALLASRRLHRHR